MVGVVVLEAFWELHPHLAEVLAALTLPRWGIAQTRLFVAKDFGID